MSESEVSRRALLAGAAIGVGVAGVSVGGVVPASADPVVSSSEGAAAAVSRLPHMIAGSDWRWVRTGSGAGRTTGSVLTDDGAAGTFRSTPLDAHAHLHVFTFADGTLLALGSGLTEGSYAVLGGTGRFTGAMGAYTARQSPKGRDGDGTATFTLALRSN